MLYSGAETGCTATSTQDWLAKTKHIAHNVSLAHTPLAERVIGYIRNQITHALRGTNK